MKILACMRQIGGANSIVPVAHNLRAGNDVFFYSQGLAYQKFSSDLPLISADSISPSELLYWIWPDVIVSECVAPEENAIIPRRIAQSAKDVDIPLVVVQDFWASGLSVVWESLPDVMCVQDKLAQDLVHRAWPKMLDRKVIITGQPAFDNLVNVNCEEEKAALKKIYGLKENWPIVHYSGGFKGIAESAACLVGALNQLREPVYLFIRFHPRMTDPNASAEWQEEYRRYQELNPQLVYGESVDSSDKKISDLINAASDIVVGAYPTMIVQACFLRKACLSITNLAAQEYFEMETAHTLKAFPPVMLGCCYAAQNVEEVVSSLEKIFSGTTLRESQEEHFVTDGRSAERVANTILGLQ